MRLGPVLIGFEGTLLDDRLRARLLHPAVGGVVLFSRNFNNISQLKDLTSEIRELRQPRLLICVDQEGGRVQRLREGFTPLPPLARLGADYQRDRDRAMDLAYRHARVMAAEVLACGIDASFAPVLDLNRGSSVIGDRAFSATADCVVQLGRAYLAGMHDAGMKTTGKHYPGHGSVYADSHTHEVMDTRSLAQLERSDLVPFKQLAPDLDALMIAHVTYPAVDLVPAGYSSKWLLQYLRGEQGYRGVIISDDLGMQAARSVGDLCARTRSCLQSGCDLVLVCRPEDVEELLPRIESPLPDAGPAIDAMYGTARLSHEEMFAAASQGVGEWRQWQESLRALCEPGINPGVA
jgi:beta-N-acetylhexosaminidase